MNISVEADLMTPADQLIEMFADRCGLPSDYIIQEFILTPHSNLTTEQVTEAIDRRYLLYFDPPSDNNHSVLFIGG